MLMHARSLRSCYRKRRAQANNQCKCDCDSQFHTASLAADMTRKHDARIHEFVVLRIKLSLQDSDENRLSCSKFPQRQLAGYWRGVYLLFQDDFFLQPLWIYVPLLALLLGLGRGIGGVASSDRLNFQKNRHPHEPRPSQVAVLFCK